MNAPISAPLTPAQVTWRSRSSFLVSFAFLTRERRRGLMSVYAFCRVVDDAVDDCSDPVQGAERLAFWREELARAYGGEPTTEIGRGVQDAAVRFGVEHEHLELVVDGVSMDLEARCFSDLDALEAYCYRVASAVGLACLPVFGVHDPAARSYARSLGLALQLTNVLRDLRPDALRGRVYVPRDHLEAAGVEIDWLTGSGPDAAYRENGPIHQLVAGLSARAHEHFGDAERALRDEWRRAVLPAQIMGEIYRRLLELVDARGGEVRGPVPRLAAWRKAWIAWGVSRRGRRTG